MTCDISTIDFIASATLFKNYDFVSPDAFSVTLINGFDAININIRKLLNGVEEITIGNDTFKFEPSDKNSMLYKHMKSLVKHAYHKVEQLRGNHLVKYKTNTASDTVIKLITEFSGLTNVVPTDIKCRSIEDNVVIPTGRLDYEIYAEDTKKITFSVFFWNKRKVKEFVEAVYDNGHTSKLFYPLKFIVDGLEIYETNMLYPHCRNLLDIITQLDKYWSEYCK